jgi:hypothetical protein
MKKTWLVIIIQLITVLSIKSTYGQDCRILNYDRFIAKGEIVNLPDSIFIFDTLSFIGQKVNYSVLDKIDKNQFKISFWNMELGGIVDPVMYKNDITIKPKGSFVLLKFDNNEGKYRCIEGIHGKRKIKGIPIILIKINNR